MDYSRNETERMKAPVLNALAEYRADVNDVGAGYNILRYASAGYIAVSAEADPQVFVDWYPRNMSYILLRLAAEGKLYYKNQN